MFDTGRELKLLSRFQKFSIDNRNTMSTNPNTTEISENSYNNISPEAAKDIDELKRRIKGLHAGKEDEERFKHYRLTRGVYGQRQFGVHMFRTKIPYGKLTTAQLIRLADTSEKFTPGNLHITTRQNIQFHYVKLNDSPKVWEALADAGVTAREACGNTVRNITASAIAGIDPNEPFDVTPYVHQTFEYFLRNPICQEMGRKIKIAFSSSEADSAYTYFHDFGFIPRVKKENGEEVRGFKLVIAGGLGAVGQVAQTVSEFLHEDEIIPYMEAAIRVFDRYGEREKRMKARMKFLVKKLGVEEFSKLVEQERTAIANKIVKIDRNLVPQPEPAAYKFAPSNTPIDAVAFDLWKRTNVFEQKQKNWFAVQVRIPLGDIDAERARQLATLIKDYAADDLRLTVNQGLVIKYVREEHLPHIFNELTQLGFAQAGFDSTADITACPGTDTCVLGVTNSTGLATKLSELIQDEFPSLVEESNIKIKISGCMNGCGQHTAANIGFHGSSIKKGAMVIPAMQVVIGGGVDKEGKGFIAEKVIKIPTKRIPEVLRSLFNDYEDSSLQGEYFNDYYYRLGKRYFYDLLKPLAKIESLSPTDFFDWGQDAQYRQEIGVGECAGVSLDVIGTIINDAKEKLQLASEALEHGAFADSIYNSYAAFVIGAKALLLAEDVKCNSQRKIISDFQELYVEAGKIEFEGDFSEVVLQINKQEPSEEFARSFLQYSQDFFKKVIEIREKQLADTGQDKLVVGQYYNA